MHEKDRFKMKRKCLVSAWMLATLLFVGISASRAQVIGLPELSGPSKECIECHKKADPVVYQQWGESKHYRVIQALPLVMGEVFSSMAAYLDNCRRKRNVSEYDAVGTISEKEIDDLLQTVQEFRVEVQKWLEDNHPELSRRG